MTQVIERPLTLDVGCGDNKQGDVGCDIRCLKGVDVICDVTHLPFKDNCFAKVHSSVVIEHTAFPVEFLCEQIRVLMDGGRLVCEADNARYLRYHISFTRFGEDFVTHFRSPFYSASDEHYMIFYPECIVRILSKIGLKNIHARHLTPNRKLDRIIATLLPQLYKNMCRRFIVSGEK